MDAYSQASVHEILTKSWLQPARAPHRVVRQVWRIRGRQLERGAHRVGLRNRPQGHQQKKHGLDRLHRPKITIGRPAKKRDLQGIPTSPFLLHLAGGAHANGPHSGPSPPFPHRTLHARGEAPGAR